MTFVHFNVHSKASMLFGSADIKSIALKTKELGQPAVALTDYSNLYEALNFYKCCKEADIKPILGADVHFVEDAVEAKAHKIRQTLHLTLIAESDIGFKNIARIISEAHNTDHYFFKPRVDFALLEKYKEGVICLSGSSADGAISYYMYDKKDSNGEVKESAALFKGKALVRRFVKLFGIDHFLLEVQDTGHEFQQALNDRLRILAKQYGIKTIATGNVHYVEAPDAESHKTLLAMSNNQYNVATATAFEQEEFYFKSREEMLNTSLHEDEIDFTLALAERCNVTIDLKKRRLPSYAFIPEGKTAMEYLREIVYNKFDKIGLGDVLRPDGEEGYVARLERELADIEEMGFADYFLIVHDVIDWVLKQDILVGYGRGSAGGSLVSYILRITNIDPLQYGLIWERFLNKGRGGLPDIDTDIPRSKRKKVLDYIQDRFGEGNVAQLVTLGGLHARSVLKEVFKVYGMPFDEANAITALVPAKNDEHVAITLAEAIETVPELQEYEEKYKPWFAIARKLEGCYKTTGIHASAIVISDKSFEDSEYPMTRSKEGNLIFGWDMGTVDSLNLLKLDILGLTTLDDIQVTREIVKKRRGIELSRETMPLDDPVTYAMLAQGFTCGVFQIEKQLGRTWSKNLKPESIEELSDLISIIRPGAMESDMHTAYRGVKCKGDEPSYIHKDLEPIMSRTYSALIYQEQVIEICQRLANMSLVDADMVRKAMGKKKPEEMRQWKEVFTNGCKENNINEEAADEIWGYIENFAGYGFNRSHGVGYALLAYETAYLKANYTIEFLCAKLRNAEGDSDKLSQLIYDAKLFGIEVTPPRVSLRNKDFDIVDDKTIAFGLSALKGVGKAAINDLSKFTKDCHTIDEVLWTLATNKTKVSSGVIVALIRGGAFDDWCKHRVRVQARFHLLDSLTDLEKASVQLLAVAESDVDDWTRFVRSLADEQKYERIKEKYGVKVPNTRRRERLRELLQEYDGADLFDSKAQRIAWEQFYLGISLSGSEADIYKSRNKCVDLVRNGSPDMPFEIAICIDKVNEIITKKGDPMAFLTVRDDTYLMDNVVVFPRQFEEHKKLLEAGNVIRISGKIDDRGSLITNRISRLQ
jgi:DNA polymerase-3 subunit alpha